MKLTVLVTAQTPIAGYAPTGSVVIELAPAVTPEERAQALTAAVLRADQDLTTGLHADAHALLGDVA